MPIKTGKIWEDNEFDELGWNNNRLYGLMLPGRRHKLKLILDYAVRNPISDAEFGKWELVPVELVFADVVNLKIDFDSKKLSEIDIVCIERASPRPTPNGRMVYWDYKVELSSGSLITFTGTSFVQTAIGNSIKSDAYDLDRE